MKPVPSKQLSICGVTYYPDGREVCDKTTAGRREYKRRISIMLERQGYLCGLRISKLCPGNLFSRNATMEHQDGRGMGGAHRDDSIFKDGKPYNLAACIWCQGEKGSKRL